MNVWREMVDSLIAFLPSLSMVIGSAVVLLGSHWFLIARHRDLGNERKFPRQIVILCLALLSLVAIVLSLPINESSRNQIIGLIGLLVSAIIAFSSTNVVANFMAGILLRITKPFRTGDFVRVGDHFGRVSERGLFDVEIQSESRELIALPNTYLISNPITTTRNSGTIVSITLSLGYDIHHSRIEPLLIRAAEKIGLEEPFVHILELGNYAITYRIAGLLTDVKWLITARSNLFKSVLETLHGEGVEIMSPTYMNQRQLNGDKRIVPSVVKRPAVSSLSGAEDIVFDKAEKAERIEKERQHLAEETQRLEALLKEATEEEKERIKRKVDANEERLKALEAMKKDLSE